MSIARGVVPYSALEGLGFSGLGFRVLGFRGSGFSNLGVLGSTQHWSFRALVLWGLGF